MYAVKLYPTEKYSWIGELMPNIDVTNSSKFKIIIAIVFVVLMTLSTMPTIVRKEV